MAEALRDLLLDSRHADALASAKPDTTTLEYLDYLAQQSLDSIQSTESPRLSSASHSLLLSLQSLSKRSYKPVVKSAADHASLRETLPVLSRKAAELSQAVPKLDSEADSFSVAFNKASDSKILAKRKESLRLLQNSERLVDVMELPPLLSSSVSATPVSYSSTLDLYAHVRRLSFLYPQSPLVSSVLVEADASIRLMALSLMGALRTPTLKLAAAVRTVGWLRRLIPDLVSAVPPEDILPALFLVCRLQTLLTTLDALEPLRELADKERQQAASNSAQKWSGGQQTERYLKRFIEIFREHSFNIISVYKSVSTSFAPTSSDISAEKEDPLNTLPSALSTLPLHLPEMLLETLSIYLPTVKDQASRESILTQVLYCAGSMGRLGADFGMLLSSLGVTEWVELVKRHRLLAGRLESVIGDYRGQQQSVTAGTS